tara:strand:+ start:37 stop:249 length:213 start_codon:yes stop_codon:yes gene_type:complete
MRQIFINALIDKYNAEISDATAKIIVYLDHPVAIGEHPQFTEELDKLISIISNAEENIKTINKHFGEYND